MSRIESRPSKRELGEYIFFVDLDITNAKNGAHIKLIEELKPLCEHLVHFGAYPSTSL